MLPLSLRTRRSSSKRGAIIAKYAMHVGVAEERAERLHRLRGFAARFHHAFTHSRRVFVPSHVSSKALI